VEEVIVVIEDTNRINKIDKPIIKRKIIKVKMIITTKKIINITKIKIMKNVEDGEVEEEDKIIKIEMKK
jgi:hypothetical protein